MKTSIICICLLLFIIKLSSSIDSLSLEEPEAIYAKNLEKLHNISDSQTFIESTFRLNNVWVNPSVIRYNDVALVVYRLGFSKKDHIAFMYFNPKTWEIIKSPDIIEFCGTEDKNRLWDCDRHWPVVAEDSRIFYSNGNLHIVYNINRGEHKKIYYARVYRNETRDQTYIFDPSYLLDCTHEIGMRHQKNWSPFDYSPNNINNTNNTNNNNNNIEKNILYFIYSINPHRIMSISTNENTSGIAKAETKYITEINNFDSIWKYGEMRGGSPAVLINDDYYLSFFHSSALVNYPGITSYFMGAYLFENKPPFRISHITPFPLMSRDFLNYEKFGWPYRKVDFIAFPMGYIYDDDYIYVSYGRNDKESWILKLKRFEFLSSLIKVESKVNESPKNNENG
jgi:predicted GH43/DUF377 family glycosyl hydrolase